MMLRPFVLAALIALPMTIPVQASAQEQSAAATPQRIRSVTLTTGQKCPPSTNAEIVVCSTIEQPYRIPKEFRDDGPIPAQSQSWVNKTAAADQIGRVAAGLPDTCSPVGTGGQSGCALAANRAYAADRRAQANAATSVP